MGKIFVNRTNLDSMKNYVQLILAGILGGLVVLGFAKWSNLSISHDNAHYAVPANFSEYRGIPMNSVDFVESARKTTGTVVHIYAEESQEQVMKKQQERRQRYRDPFSDFFGFGDFFEGNFYRPKNGTGSGVLYNREGYIITNNHVVGFADKIKVTDHKGREYTAKKIGTDASTDLAVIKIEPKSDLAPVKFGNSDVVQVGEWVLAVGNPFGYLTSTVTAGIVSAKGRSLDIINEERAIEDFIQTDAAINPGNSGGALVNLNGELIGINTAIATPTGVFAGYSFAIPSNIVREVVKDIIEKGGDVDRSTSLGIGGYDVTDELAKEFGLSLKSNEGFYVEEVDKKSAAHLGGIIPGDVIIEVDKNKVRNYDDISKALLLKKVGDKIELKIIRGGKEMIVPVQLRKSF